MSQSFVSVIIPVYNVEKYLKKCLESVINQTYKDLEIICVYDESSDKSLDILREYEKTDSRIKVILSDKKEGLGAARNKGLKYATGEYLYFLDSDDWIDADYIEKMLSALIKNNTDIVANIGILFERTNKSPFLMKQLPLETFEHEILLDARSSIFNINWSVWSKMYRKSFIDNHKLSFPVVKNAEDVYFQFITFANTEKLCVIKQPNYHYTVRDESLYNADTQKDISLLKVYDLAFEYLKENSFLSSGIKLFCVDSTFNISSFEKYEQFKEYFLKVQRYVDAQKELYSRIDLFFMNNILSSKTYEEYCQTNCPNVLFSFLRKDSKRKTIEKDSYANR